MVTCNSRREIPKAIYRLIVVVFVALMLGACSQYEGETCQSTGILVVLTWLVFAFGFGAGALWHQIRTDRDA